MRNSGFLLCGNREFHFADFGKVVCIFWNSRLRILEFSLAEYSQFDPAAMQALEETGEILEGTDYQHGKRYGLANLREAVFTRDHYRCRICGKGVENGVILHAHHIRYRSEGGTDRINNLLTVCSKCHTPKNHKPGGKLYGLKPLTGTYKDATFMNIVRWQIINTVRQQYAGVEVENTYGPIPRQAEEN